VITGGCHISVLHIYQGRKINFSRLSNSQQELEKNRILCTLFIATYLPVRGGLYEEAYLVFLSSYSGHKPPPTLALTVSGTRSFSLSYSCFPRHCNEKNAYVFPEKELRGLSPNFHIHVSVRDLYIPGIGPQIFLQQNRQTDPGNIYIARRHMNVEIGTDAKQFLIWKSFFRIFGIVSLQCVLWVEFACPS
jgi:hypothetical protein